MSHLRGRPLPCGQCRPRCAPFSSMRSGVRPVPAVAVAPARKGRSTVVVTRAAMFDSLSRSMDKAFKLLSKTDKLTPENMKEPLKEVRRALLEADVSLPVVRRFIKKVEETAAGTQVIASVTPDMQLKKVVFDQLTALMGSKGAKDLEQGFPQIILMAGLQGVGKTTACGKLALYLQKQKKSVLMVATDVYRPAAIDQLVKLGETIGVPVFEMGTETSPIEIAKRGIEEAKRRKVDAVIVDTAGRLQIDDNMMEELKGIKAAVRPTDTLLVVDAMTGQEAASLVKAFNDQAGITGAILTKMDGDSRGGAALSVREVSGQPIKFVGVGEKMESLEPFYPERMAQRILGMGDVLTLWEKANESIKEDEAQSLMNRMMSSKFDFNDFLAQSKMMSNMGGAQMLKLLPMMNQVSERALYEAEKQMKEWEAMIGVMMDEERSDPDMLIKSAARRRRIAQDSGRSEVDVSNMLARFNQMRAQARKMSGMLRLSGAQDAAAAEAAGKELIASSMQGVAPGKVRRKREKISASKGFGAPATKK